MNEEDYINSILNSVNKRKIITPDDSLFSKIHQRVSVQSMASRRTIWIAAASILILITLNFILLSITASEKQNATAVLEHSIHKSNQLY